MSRYYSLVSRKDIERSIESETYFYSLRVNKLTKLKEDVIKVSHEETVDILNKYILDTKVKVEESERRLAELRKKLAEFDRGMEIYGAEI